MSCWSDQYVLTVVPQVDDCITDQPLLMQSTPQLCSPHKPIPCISSDFLYPATAVCKHIITSVFNNCWNTSKLSNLDQILGQIFYPLFFLLQAVMVCLPIKYYPSLEHVLNTAIDTTIKLMWPAICCYTSEWIKYISAMVRSKNMSLCWDVVDESENDTLTSISDGEGVLFPMDDSTFVIPLLWVDNLEDLLWRFLSDRFPLDACIIFPSSVPSQWPSSYNRQNADATVAMSHTSSLRVTLLKSAHNLNL